jgi:hypothetical protein
LRADHTAFAKAWKTIAAVAATGMDVADAPPMVRVVEEAVEEVDCALKIVENDRNKNRNGGFV